MVAVGEFIGGVLLTLFAGLLNGSWNIVVKPTAPPSLRAVGTQEDKPPKWEYEHAWMSMMINAIPVNVAICFALIAPDMLFSIVSDSTTSDVLLICLFSFLWGLGTYGFGLSIQIAGLGMGTTLNMSVIVVVGTFLPLLLDVEAKLATASGYIIVGGLFVCTLSFLAAAKALTLKDLDEALLTHEPSNLSDPNDAELTIFPSPIISTSKSSPSPPPEYSTFSKVLVCVVSGILCTMLQFAFVFSEDMRNIAETEYGVPAALTAGVTFFFAITICPIPNILIPLYKLHRSSTLTHLTSAPDSKSNYLKTLFLMSLPWVVQSHLYGLSAASLLGPTLGSAVGWPLLIVTTNVTGLVIGWKFLGEWEKAKEKTINVMKTSIALSIFGLAIVSVGGLI